MTNSLKTIILYLKETMMENNYNNCTVAGTITEVTNGITYLSITRKSGKEDMVKVKIPDNYAIGDTIIVRGKIKTESYYDTDNVRHLRTFIEGNGIYTFTDDQNTIRFEGYLCKEPILRVTPKGQRIVDYCIAVQDGGQSYYIYCITFGDATKLITSLNIGDKIHLKGCLQSRDYIKNGQPRTCNEVVGYDIHKVIMEAKDGNQE